MKLLWVDFKKKAKLKTEKAVMQDAKRVSIFMRNNEIMFEPYKNQMSQRTFYRLPNAISILKPIPSNIDIGKETRKAWEKCFFI
jgi:hypothetical protein